MGSQQSVNGVDEVKVEQVGCRQVHRDREGYPLIAPGPDLSQGEIEHSGGDRPHQAGLFGGGQKLVG